jgi:hypothetical protein
MDTRRESNGWQTFFEHWWFLPIAVIAFTSSQLISFFTRMTDTRWIWCFAISLVATGVGVALIFYAKIPLYRQRRFFTFGSSALPESRRALYRWGYRSVFFAVALLLCLLWSRP